MTRAQNRQHTLWHLIAGPAIWSLYFLISYVAAAVYCAKAGPAASLAPIRLLVAALAAAAIGGIAYSGRHGWKRLFVGGEPRPPHGADTTESREQFLALATVLLCGLGLVATVYVAIPALFLTTCR